MQNSPENRMNKAHTRAKIIRNMNNTQHISDKAQKPEVYKMKWKYAEIMRIGSTNMRNERSGQKRRNHPTNGKTQYRHNVFTRNKNTGPLLRSKERIYLRIFISKHDYRTLGSRNLLRKLHGKYRNYYKQISSNIMSMEINMHGNPMIIISTYIPHDDSDNNSRQSMGRFKWIHWRHTRSNKGNYIR